MALFQPFQSEQSAAAASATHVATLKPPRTFAENRAGMGKTLHTSY